MRILALVILIVITAFSFWPSLWNGFTNWDDYMLVVQNPGIQKIGFSNADPDLFIPLVFFSYSLEYHFFGLNPFVYHLTNLILHLLNAALVFWFFYLLSGRKIFVAFWTALFFAVHPLRVESVAWVSERKDVLFAFFYLAAMTSYLYYLAKQKTKFLIYTTFFFLLSFLSKPMAASFPCVALLLDWRAGRKWSRRLFLEKIPLFAILGLMTLVHIFLFYQSTLDPNPLKVTGSLLSEPWRSLGGAFLFYVVKLVAPVSLSAVYSEPVYRDYTVCAYLLMAVFVGGLWYFRRRTRTLTFGFVFFALTLSPVVARGLWDFMITADHYSYLPSLGLVYPLVEGARWLLDKKKLRWVITGFFVLAAVALGYLTWHRNLVWKDSLTIMTDALKYPSKMAHFIYNNRGNAWLEKGKVPEAIMDYTRAIGSRPDFAESYYNRGSAYGDMRAFDEAARDYTRALALKPRYAEAYYNRGLAYLGVGDWDGAITDFLKALSFKPRSAAAYSNLGIAYQAKGLNDDARRAWQKALDLQPGNTTARHNLRELARDSPGTVPVD